MSNFKRSILYSTSVLAAGLLAIGAIYQSIPQNGMDGAVMSDITPAAGTAASDLGVNFDTDADIKAAAISESGKTEAMVEKELEETAQAFEDASQKTRLSAEQLGIQFSDTADEAAEQSAEMMTEASETIDATMDATAEELEDISAAAGVEMTEEEADDSSLTITLPMEEGMEAQ